MTNFSAGAQSLGYLYQVRYALDSILTKSPDVELYLENLDDISFEKKGSSLELIQTKHHSTPANLTDSSSDLWKTIRVWSTRFKKKEIDITIADLTLVTNGTVADHSIAYYLSSEKSTRDIKKAIEKLDDIAVTSSNADLQSAFKAYQTLSQEEKESLLSCVRIIPNSQDIVSIQESIKSRLRLSVRPEFLDDLVTRVEGWWFARAIKSLSSSEPILAKDLNAQIYNLQEEYRQDSLPIHDFEEETPDVDEVDDKDRCFIEQLKLVKVGRSRIAKAVSDYYRAYSQRSKWLRGGHLHLSELTKYELKLIDEWERIFLAVKDEVQEGHPEDEMQRLGREIFNRIETTLELNIRPRATEPFIMRGTYHSLSNKGYVGWHPDFKERLNELFERALENASDKDSEQNPGTI